MKNYSLFILLAFLIGMGCGEPSVQSEKQTPQPKSVTPTSEKITSPKSDKKTIVFFGNSLSAGYGLDPSQGFVGLFEKRIDSLAYDYQVINAGLSGETTAGGDNRVDWILDRQKVDVFVLELGGNDMLRGVDFEQSYKNLQSIITKVKTKYPSAKIVLAGMLAPPNLGDKYTTGFKEMYPKLAKINDTGLIPFLLDGVAGDATLNLPDGIHPNVKGHQIVLENIWGILQPLL